MGMQVKFLTCRKSLQTLLSSWSSLECLTCLSIENKVLSESTGGGSIIANTLYTFASRPTVSQGISFLGVSRMG